MKAFRPIWVQLSGILTFDRAVHQPKEESLIVAHPIGMVTLASALQQ
jgi:hypothetical protein